MTDDTPQANDRTSGSESVERENPDPNGTSGFGANGEEKTVVADSGTASVRPVWPGAARPAGWFLSASGEAAPPERLGTEPARADAAQTAGARAAERPGWTGAPERAAAAAPASAPDSPGVPQPTGIFKALGVTAQAWSERDEPDQDEWPGQPAAAEWAGYSQAPDEPAAGEEPGGHEMAAPYEVADSGPDDGWYDEPQPTAAHQIPQPSSWRREPLPEPWQDAPQAVPPQAGAWYEPGYAAEQDAPEYAAWQDDPWGAAFGQPAAYETPPREPRFVPVVGPTPALYGRAGGPGFVVPPGAVSGLYDPARRSGWQVAADVWEDSGISWEPPAVAPGAPGALRAPGLRSQSWPADDYDDWPERAAPAFAAAPAFSAAPAFTGAANFAGAPTLADAPAAARPSAPPLPGRWRDEQAPGGLGEPDELYRAWQGSVRQAAARPGMTPARRRRAWKVVRVGVPAAVLVTVGAGAAMMLTGKANEMLASTGNQAAPDAGDSAAAFAGYPGQQGTVTVNSIAAAGGIRLAVGGADGHPAIWRRAADGSWTLISASSPAVYQRPGTESLLSIAHGPAGWLAVGGAGSGSTQQPVVLTSADGASWQPITTAAFVAQGISVTGVTASARGYVIVGKQASNGRTFAAMWWSGDLRNWTPGSNGGLDGRVESSAVYAVGATATGFIAAGTHGGDAAIWTSADGRNWSVYDVPSPPGASAALLQQVAVNGTRVVTAGYAVEKAGDVPILAVSTDSGAHWQMLLTAPGGYGTVTTLTAAGSGFVAAGLAGTASAQHAVTWKSPDGLTWSAATPVSAGQITALTAVGTAVSGTAQQGAGPAVVTLTAP